MKIIEYSNKLENEKFYVNYNIGSDISYAMKKFGDFDENNYLITYIHGINKNMSFDEDLYNSYHNEYYKYYSKNPLIKLLVYTNGKKGVYWCWHFFQFFNMHIYYRPLPQDDADFLLKDLRRLPSYL
jgi:hypothetical protein